MCVCVLGVCGMVVGVMHWVNVCDLFEPMVYETILVESKGAQGLWNSWCAGHCMIVTFDGSFHCSSNLAF